MATSTASPFAPLGAVQIPNRKFHNCRRGTDRARSVSSRGTKNVHSPDSIPPAVAALLAITNIPPPKRRKGSRQQRDMADLSMSVDAIVPRSGMSEKNLSQEMHLSLSENSSLASFEQSPLDLLLTPPDELEEDDMLLPPSAYGSPKSMRTGSFDSLPSLEESLSPCTMPSFETPITPRGGKVRYPRRSLEPVIVSPGEEPEDPLSKMPSEEEILDFSVLSAKPVTATDKVIMPFKSSFKSNLTASLRALRSAARSLSSFTTSSIPPNDFLTRSILTIDSLVPYTDERRPPLLEEEPSEAMRRYLNPARGSTPIRSYTASIQMQTYRIQRTRGAPKATRPPAQSPSPSKSSTVELFPPGPRQREMRENPDFIRIAVIEQLMRKRGKLDDQREGHARWLLPPRKAVTKPYEIGPGGVPVRWMPLPQDD